MSNDDAAFDEIVEGLSDLADINIEEITGPQTPWMDHLLDWQVVDGKIDISAAAPVVRVLAAVVKYLRSDNAPDWNATNLLDVPSGDLRSEAMAEQAADLTTEAERCITAAQDFLLGNLPLSACFDAARGFQQIRLRLLAEPAITEADALAAACAVFSEELLELALA